MSDGKGLRTDLQLGPLHMIAMVRTIGVAVPIRSPKLDNLDLGH